MYGSESWTLTEALANRHIHLPPKICTRHQLEGSLLAYINYQINYVGLY